MKTPSTLSKFSLALIGATLSASLWAAGAADSIAVSDPYVRQAPPGARATGAFMVLKNTGDKDVKLVKAESAAAKMVELHNHINEGGVMKMRKVDAITIKAKGEAALKPGSYHVMLMDMAAPMKEGDLIAITLGFDDGSTAKIAAPVKKPQAAAVQPKQEMRQHGH